MIHANSSTLVVCPDEAAAERYANWLIDLTEVTVATNRPAEDSDGTPYEIIVVDDGFVGGTGDGFVERFRSMEPRARIVLLAVEQPDPTLVRRGVDECLLKPVTPKELQTCVETLLLRSKYDRELRRFYELVAKRAAIEDGRRETGSDASEEWIRLQQEIASAREAVDRTLNELSSLEGYPTVFQAMMTNPG